VRAIQAASIDRELAGALRRGGRRGEVLSTHRKAAYLAAQDGRLVVLAGEEAGNGPGFVVVPGVSSFAAGPGAVVPGEPWEAAGSLLVVGGGRLGIETEGATAWDAELRILPLRNGARERADAALEIAQAGRPAGALGALIGDLAAIAAGGTPCGCGTVERRVRLLADALAAGSGVAAAASALVGLGDGLTPSCDDLLAGLAWTLRLFSGDRRHGAWARGALAAVAVSVEEAGSRTTPVSRHFLRAAARGRFAERPKNLLEAVRGGGEKTVAEAAVRMLHCGATSGADLVFGVALGFLVLSRREKEGL